MTGGVYTCFSSGYEVIASLTTLIWQRGIAHFCRGSNSYVVEETRIWGLKVISLHLMKDSIRLNIIGCYIPPSNLETLTDIDKAWRSCPKETHPILVGNLNLNLCAPLMEHKETIAIAKQVDAMDLDVYVQGFLPRLGEMALGAGGGGCG
jgi:hypothetical protein